MKLAIAILGLMSISLTTSAAVDDAFEGNYTQAVSVAGNSCVTMDTCFIDMTNDVSIATLGRDIYEVQITTLNQMMASCVFKEVMTRNGDALTYEGSNDGCSVKIKRTNQGLSVNSTGCENRCNLAVSLEGTGYGFVKQSNVR